jgi:hypothetical protein
VKRFLKILLSLFAMAFFLSSCSEIHKLYSNDQNIADNTMAEISEYINCSKNKSLSLMFSKKALTAIENIDEKLKKFVARLHSGIKEYELATGPMGSGEYYYGNKVESIGVGYKILTNDNEEYYIGFSKVYTCSEYDDLLGLSSLRLTKNDDALWDIRENEFYIEVE